MSNEIHRLWDFVISKGTIHDIDSKKPILRSGSHEVDSVFDPIRIPVDLQIQSLEFHGQSGSASR